MNVVLQMPRVPKHQGPFPLRSKVRRASREELQARGIVLDLLAREHYSKLLREGCTYNASAMCYPRRGGGFTCYLVVDVDGICRELDCKLFVLTE